MSDAEGRGITVTEITSMGQPIDVAPETTAVLIGRALRGPLDEAIPVATPAAFRRRFGGTWSRSSLGPAVEQFFEHGGRRLYVVRVANDARGAMVCLPAHGSALVLRAVEPGSTERLRAAVDYDGIDDDGLFNLTLQRLDPGTGLVMDQEFHRKLSVAEDSDNYVVDALLASDLARVEQPFPMHRPEATHGDRIDTGYVEAVQAGTDGRELSDYDLVGSRVKGTGLFALQQVETVDLVYLPPPGKDKDLGPAATLAAERYCCERGAMLIVDPPHACATSRAALEQRRRDGVASENTVGYFPRIVLRDDDEAVPRVAGGALAGLLCKTDRHCGPWTGFETSVAALSRRFRPAIDLDDEESATLVRAGINAIRTGPGGRARLAGSVTLGRGNGTSGSFASLPVRRACLRILKTVADATRWAVFEQADDRLRTRLEGQVDAYLAALADVGAFEPSPYSVECEVRPREDSVNLANDITLFLVFRPLGCGKPLAFTLHQSITGCRTMPTAFAPVGRNSD